MSNNKTYYDTTIKGLNIVIILLLVAFVAVVSFYIVYNAEWILGDDKQTMLYTGSGKCMPMLSELIGGGVANGRFSPTAHQEYNLLTLISYGHTPLAHYILNAVMFVALSMVSICFLRNIQHYYFKSDNIILPILVYLFLFVGCTHITAFLDVIFGARFISLLLILFFYWMFLNVKTGKYKYLIYTTPIVLWITYNGEICFVPFLVIGASLLIFNRKYNSKSMSRFAIFLVCSALSFLLVYAFYVLPQSVSKYKSIPNDNFFRDLLTWTPHAALILVLSAVRFYYILIRKDLSRIYIDSILFGGAGLVLANIVLKLSAAYYYIIVMVFLMPSVLYWGYYFFLKRKSVFYILCITMLLLFIRPLHLFPYLIKNNQKRRTTEMTYIRQVEPLVEKDGFRLVFLKGMIPEDSYNRNKCIFIKRTLKETFEFETKRDINVIEEKDITNQSFPYIFLTREDALYMDSKQKDYLVQRYDSVLTFGDLNCVFYTKHNN